MKCKACGQESLTTAGAGSNWAPLIVDWSNQIKFEKEEPIDFGNSTTIKKCCGRLFICLDCGTVRVESSDLNTNE